MTELTLNGKTYYDTEDPRRVVVEKTVKSSKKLADYERRLKQLISMKNSVIEPVPIDNKYPPDVIEAINHYNAAVVGFVDLDKVQSEIDEIQTILNFFKKEK